MELPRDSLLKAAWSSPEAPALPAPPPPASALRLGYDLSAAESTELASAQLDLAGPGWNEETPRASGTWERGQGEKRQETREMVQKKGGSRGEKKENQRPQQEMVQKKGNKGRSKSSRRCPGRK